MSRSGSGGENPNFLGRWARRKAAARTERSDEAPPVPAVPAVAPTEPSPADEQPPAPIPSIESLDEHSDYARFMARDVGKDLRRLALRKLFKAPVFNIRDGLDDYDEDFTTFKELGNLVTADMKFHKERLETDAAVEKPRAEQTPVELAENIESADQPATGGDQDIKSEEQKIAAETTSTGTGPAPALVVRQLPPERPPEDAPPVLAPRRQRVKLQVEADDINTAEPLNQAETAPPDAQES